MVITSRSTINSVFFLILDFISVGCLFIMVGAEFLGMIILIVYVGAVAVFSKWEIEGKIGLDFFGLKLNLKWKL